MYGLVLERCSCWALAVCDETSNWFVVRNRIQQFRCHISGGQSGGHSECMYLGRACELCGLFICLWTRVGAASGLVGCQYVVLRCGAIGTCWPQLSTVVWAGKGVGQPLWTKDSITCVVKTYRAKQASGGCEHSCDGRADVHTILNHLQSRLKEFVRDPIFLACPKLLQVTICYFSIIFH